MIVYGDAEQIEDAARVRAEIGRALRAAEAHAAGLPRHAALVNAFIRASELFQAMADAEFEATGFDRSSPAQEAGALILVELARAVDRSWGNGFRTEIGTALNLIDRLDCTGPLRTRTCEGYAHYALYPENYLAAARHSGLDDRCRVVGIRSIGLGLAAMVTAAIGARPPVSVRPAGHPFRREIRAAPELIARDADDPSVHFAIVDEGPGLSGSSFAAVARWLFAQGVEPGRVHFFPSHGGEPGAQADDEVRAIWRAVRRHPAARFDIVREDSIAGWISDLVGPVRKPLKEITTAVRFSAGHAGIPSDTRFARRKFIAETGTGTWLVRFAGLGAVGGRKLRDAAALADAGLSPRVAGLRHGFLIQEWVDGEPPAESDRRELLAVIGRYLAFRSSRLGPPSGGATLDALKDMALVNTREALGPAASTPLEALFAARPVEQSSVRPMRSDNRMHAWEWLRTDGGILKLDAVDHCESHDLIGCQDIAWDIAGAMVEQELSPAETVELRRSVATAGGPVIDEALLAVMLVCYLAFQAGLWGTAIAADEAGFARQRQRADFYARQLARMLDAPTASPI